MKIKRILCLLLSIIMLGGALVSCKDTASTGTDSQTTSGQETSDVSDTTAASVTTAPTQPEEPETYIPKFMVAQQWHYSAPSDGGKHVLLACTYKTVSYFDAGDNLGGNPLNIFTTGDSENKKAIPSVNDPLFLSRFEACLYDYSYHIIYLDYPNDVDDKREDYLAGLKKMIDLCKEIQPDTPVVFVNTTVKGGEEDVKALFEENGYLYWNYYRENRSDFIKAHKQLAAETPYKLRENIGENETPADELPNYKESLYWEITEINDPYKVENKLPRVLLIGDSICYGYRKEVRSLLSEVAYVDTYAVSFAIADVAVLRDMRYLLENFDYDVIHINIAFHNCTYDMQGNAYATYLEQLLKDMQELAPNATIIFATGTTSSSKNENGEWEFNENTYGIWKDRRDMAVEVCEKLNITVNDLYTLCLEVNPAKADDLHFADQTALSEQVVRYITEAMAARK